MDILTRRKKQQELMVQLVERRVRSRAQQLYETRGEGDGQDLQDWFQAEAEILENNVVAPLYYRMRTSELLTKEVERESILNVSAEMSSAESFSSNSVECETVA
jgi:hypothetical protein